MYYIKSFFIACLIKSFVFFSYKNNFFFNFQFLLDKISLSSFSYKLIFDFNKNSDNHDLFISSDGIYVSYFDQYKTKNCIDFNRGKVTVETALSANPVKYLEKAIIEVLLSKKTLFSKRFFLNKKNFLFFLNFEKPFLYGKILDHYFQPISWKWKAKRFANFLLKNRLEEKKSDLGSVWSITMNLIPDSLYKNIQKYLSSVNEASKKYNVDQSLILSIIQVESNFNPNAVSCSKALGLMQIKADTAGKDVFLAQGKPGIPSVQYLLNPTNNIDLGTAYLSLLQNRYLKGIKDHNSLRYATIISYNSGVKNLFRLFHLDKNKSLEIINKMSSKDFYKVLLKKYPIQQSKDYLNKVSRLQDEYFY